MWPQKPAARSLARLLTNLTVAQLHMDECHRRRWFWIKLEIIGLSVPCLLVLFSAGGIILFFLVPAPIPSNPHRCQFCRVSLLFKNRCYVSPRDEFHTFRFLSTTQPPPLHPTRAKATQRGELVSNSIKACKGRRAKGVVVVYAVILVWQAASAEWW